MRRRGAVCIAHATLAIQTQPRRVSGSGCESFVFKPSLRYTVARSDRPRRPDCLKIVYDRRFHLGRLFFSAVSTRQTDLLWLTEFVFNAFELGKKFEAGDEVRLGKAGMRENPKISGQRFISGFPGISTLSGEISTLSTRESWYFEFRFFFFRNTKL